MIKLIISVDVRAHAHINSITILLCMKDKKQNKTKKNFIWCNGTKCTYKWIEYNIVVDVWLGDFNNMIVAEWILTIASTQL